MNPGNLKGQQTSSLAEFVDVYPTICELADLPLPQHLEGRSLMPIINDPSAIVNKVALS